MQSLLLILFVFQGAFIIYDETFHWKRRLGQFERRGHILDAALFAAPLFLAGYYSPSAWGLVLFIALSVLSCLVVTKDEWIHARACGGAEQWAHAVLFLFHGSVLLLAGLAWSQGEAEWALRGMPWAVVVLMIYQIGYWLVYDAFKRRRLDREKRKSIDLSQF